MRRLPSVCLGLLLSFLFLASIANAEKISIDDLLNPELPTRINKTDDNQKLAQNPNEQNNIDDLLGPKDVFPFLPDNHRDSGTGKFNSF